MSLPQEYTVQMTGMRGPEGGVSEDLSALEANVVAKAAAANTSAADAATQAGNAATQAGLAQGAASDAQGALTALRSIVYTVNDPWAPADLASVDVGSNGLIVAWTTLAGVRHDETSDGFVATVTDDIAALQDVAPYVINDPWAPSWLLAVAVDPAGVAVSWESRTGERWPGGGGGGSTDLTAVVAGINLEARKRTLAHLVRAMRDAMADNPAINSIYASGGGVVTVAQAASAPAGLSDVGNLVTLLNSTGFPVRTGGGNPQSPYGTAIRSSVPSYGYPLPSFEIAFDGDQICIQIENSGTGFRLIADGHYVGAASTPTLFALADGTYVTLTFAKAGVHRVIVEREGNGAILAVLRQPTSQVWKPGARIAKALVPSDSYGQATGTTFAHNGWARRASLRLGIDGIPQGVGGSGYVNDGSGKKVGDATRLAIVSAQTYDIIAVAVGINDASSTYYGSVQANALAYFQALRTAQPNALIVVTGAWPGSTGPSTGSNSVTAVEAAAKAAFDSWADPFSIFLPVSQATTDNRPWIYGTGRTGAPAANGNADKYIGATSGTDATHPNDAGHDYLGERFAISLAAAVEQMAAKYQILTA